jgi:hypothetical protein
MDNEAPREPVTVIRKSLIKRPADHDAPAAQVAHNACSLHPAFDFDNCPACGTARVIG